MEFHHIARKPDAFQRSVTADEVRAMCRRAFGDDVPVASVVELGLGTYNSTYRVEIAAERPVILRVASGQSLSGQGCGCRPRKASSRSLGLAGDRSSTGGSKRPGRSMTATNIGESASISSASAEGNGRSQPYAWATSQPWTATSIAPVPVTTPVLSGNRPTETTRRDALLHAPMRSRALARTPVTRSVQ
jgi:hypothetical protein